MAEKQTDPNFEDADPEGTANGNVRQVKDEAPTGETEGFLHKAGDISRGTGDEMYEDDFFDDEDSGEDGFYANELALLSEDLEGYLLHEFDWPGVRQRPFRTRTASREEGDGPAEELTDSHLVTTLAAQAAAARHASQAAVLMGATVPLLARQYAADESALRSVLPTLITLTANAARRLHRHPAARQAITRLPQAVGRTIVLLLRYVYDRPRLTPALTARVLNRQLQMMSRRQQRSGPAAVQSRRQPHGRHDLEGDVEWFDVDLWHGQGSF